MLSCRCNAYDTSNRQWIADRQIADCRITSRRITGCRGSSRYEGMVPPMIRRVAKPQSRLEVGADTSIGHLRTNNEDAYLLDSPLFAVADGMGGHAAGEIAARLAVDTLKAANSTRIDLSDSEKLRDSVIQANREVSDAPGKGIGRTGMGTTLTAAVIDNDRLLIAHVGDSRAYLLHDDQLRRLTRDHSYVQELIDSGRISEEDARSHPRRGVITRVLGFEDQTQPDLYEVHLTMGDRIMLCSDGLHGMLEDSAIERIMVEESSAAQCAKALVRAANKAGGIDNTTVVIIDVTSIAQVNSRSIARFTGDLRQNVAGFVLALVILFGGAATGVYLYAAKSAYLIAENGQVMLYRGLVGDVFGLKLQWPIEDTGIAVDELTPPLPDRLRQGIQLDSVEEAERLIEQYREQMKKDRR